VLRRFEFGKRSIILDLELHMISIILLKDLKSELLIWAGDMIKAVDNYQTVLCSKCNSESVLINSIRVFVALISFICILFAVVSQEWNIILWCNFRFNDYCSTFVSAAWYCLKLSSCDGCVHVFSKVPDMSVQSHQKSCSLTRRDCSQRDFHAWVNASMQFGTVYVLFHCHLIMNLSIILSYKY